MPGRRATGARTPRASALVIGLAACVVVRTSPAQEIAPDPLAAAVESIDGLEYASAAEILDGLLARTDLSARDRNRTLELLGACRVYLDRRDEGLAAFVEMVRRDPGWVLPSTYPPRVQAAFDEAMLASPGPVEVRIERVDPPPGSPPASAAVLVAAGGTAVESVWALARLPDGTIARQPFEDRQGVLVAALPVSSLPPGSAIAYTVEATAPSGFTLARLGTESEPLVALLPAPPPPPRVRPPVPEPPPEVAAPAPPAAETPWYASWWFWTVVGVAVGGGATAATVLLLPSDGPRDGSGGNWVVWP